MENVTQKRTPGEWRELFSSQEFEEAYEYGGDDLGAVYQTQGTDFALWAPTAERAELLLYRAGSAEEGAASPLTGQKRYAQKKAFSVCIKTEIFQVFIIPGW